MFSQSTINIVKSTAPILDKHGETLTRHFYSRMFTQNPEVSPFFNPANQSGGTQQRALAAAICAYAANIDNLEVLGGAVELIAQKHASLLVKPEHYPIVGENLLESIREVLGEGATDDVIAAWAEAYSFLADIFISREGQIYHKSAEQVGGWSGFKAFRIDRKVKESTVVTSFYLSAADGEKLPDYLPGQYITLRIATKGGATTMRNYSLSDQSGQGYFRISVKKEVGLSSSSPDGYVSNTLHSEREVGDLLEIAPPCGEFVFNTNCHSERPLVLLAAGIGVTPILSILKTALEVDPAREIVFIHGCLSEETQAFKSVIDALAEAQSNLKVHYRYSDSALCEANQQHQSSKGFVDAQLIESLVSDTNADYYFCGPKPFMVNIYQDLLKWGIPESQVNYEFFGPREALEIAPG